VRPRGRWRDVQRGLWRGRRILHEYRG
jgi:hypothetical protein